LTRLAFPVLLTEPPASAEFAIGDPRLKTAPWLVRRFSVSVLPTLSSITALRGAVPEGQADKPFLGVGDPLLDDHPAKIRAADSLERTQLTQVRNIRSAGNIQPQPASPTEIRQVRLERIRQQPALPDTAEELQRVASLLHVGSESLLLREAATETRVKQIALNQYRIISFATHGVLAGELGKGIEPGLILTPPKEATEQDDGFLSLSEVAQLDLNADWVVLSACNTAGGAKESVISPNSLAGGTVPYPVAEGLTGLAKAFSYAGTKALLVSHWSVSSTATVELMEHLVQNYSEKRLSRAGAHRQAMLALIESDDPLLNHPSLWAPFIVFGDGG
jgi:CHAT domain-containing protein